MALTRPMEVNLFAHEVTAHYDPRITFQQLPLPMVCNIEACFGEIQIKTIQYLNLSLDGLFCLSPPLRLEGSFVRREHGLNIFVFSTCSLTLNKYSVDICMRE